MFNSVKNFISNHKIAFSLAVILHLGVIFLFAFAKISEFKLPTPKKVEKVETIKAVSVDLALVKREKKRLLNIKKTKELQKKQAVKKQLNKLKNLKNKQKKAEKLRQKALNSKKRIEKATKKAKADKKKAEKARKRALAARKKAERAKKRALVAKKKAIKENKKAQQTKRKIEKARKKALAGKRKAEKATKKALKEQRKAEEKRRLMKEIAQELTDDEQLEQKMLVAQQLDKLKIGYISQIAAKVQSHWRRLPKTKKGWQCNVFVLQNKRGVVQTVILKKCSGGSAFQRSVRAAVFKASPLPKAPKKEIFDKEISFIFEVK